MPKGMDGKPLKLKRGTEIKKNMPKSESDSMVVSLDDWAFKVNGKTGNLEMHTPKRDAYSSEELGNVAVGLCRLMAPFGMMFDHMLRVKESSCLKKKT